MGAESSVATITQLIDLVAPWRGRDDLTVRPLTGGLSNRSFLVTTRGERFVLRAPVRAVPGPDWSGGIAAHLAAAAAGIAPPVVHADAGSGVLVTRWIDAEPFDSKRLSAADGMQRLAGLLEQLHALAPPPRTYRPLEAAAELWSWFEAHATVDRTLRAWRRLYLDEAPALAADLGCEHFCHNDLVGGNVLDDGHRLVLLDFEWAAAGDRLMELALIASSEGLASAQVDELLAALGLDATVCGTRLRELVRLADHLGAHWYLAHSVGPGGDRSLGSVGIELVRKLLRERLRGG